MNSITIAAGQTLESTYHSIFDGIFSSQAGQVITKIFAAAGLAIMLGIIFGLIFKAFNRPNVLTNIFCPSLPRIIVGVVVIFILLGPSFTFPALMKLGDWIMNAAGGGAKDYLGI